MQPQDMMGDAGEQPEKKPLWGAAEDDMCGLCHVTRMGDLPCVGLKCRHAFHAECVRKRLSEGRQTRRITFDHLDCPVCKKPMELNPLQAPASLVSLAKEKAEEKALTESVIALLVKLEGLDKRGRVANEGDHYYGQGVKYMLEQMTLYNCFKCNKVYNGGMNDYEGAIRENMDAENFLCLTCAEDELGYGKEMCPLHGNEFTDFKCNHCCSIALFVIDNGKRFFCQPCFNDHMEKKEKVKTDCEGGPDCPLQISHHPKAPARYPMGCSLCRSQKLEMLVKEAPSAGFNVEQRNDLMKKHGHINVPVAQRMPVKKGNQKTAGGAVPGGQKKKGCTIF